jgi:hypothetical protein
LLFLLGSQFLGTGTEELLLEFGNVGLGFGQLLFVLFQLLLGFGDLPLQFLALALQFGVIPLGISGWPSDRWPIQEGTC